MTPENPVVGGTVLRIPAIQSPNFSESAGTGWAIFQSGAAFFYSIVAEGTITASEFIGTDFEITSNGMYFYNGTPAPGNPPVFYVIPPGAPDTDPFGNTLGGPVLGVQGSPSSGALTIDGNGNLNLFSPAGKQVMQLSPDNTALLIYDSSGAGFGNLIASLAAQAGNDGLGNGFLQGFTTGNATIGWCYILGNGILLQSGLASSDVYGAQLSQPQPGVFAVTSGADNSGSDIGAHLQLISSLQNGNNGPVTLLTSIPDTTTPFITASNPVSGGAETWHSYALINGFTGTLNYKLNADGTVSVYGEITTPAAAFNFTNINTAPAAAYGAYQTPAISPPVLAYDNVTSSPVLLKVFGNGQMQFLNAAASHLNIINGRYPVS